MLPLDIQSDYYRAVAALDIKQNPGEHAKSFSTRFMANIRSAYGENVLSNPASFQFLFDTYCQSVLNREAVMYMIVARPQSLQDACNAYAYYSQQMARFSQQPAQASCSRETLDETVLATKQGQQDQRPPRPGAKPRTWQGEWCAVGCNSGVLPKHTSCEYDLDPWYVYCLCVLMLQAIL